MIEIGDVTTIYTTVYSAAAPTVPADGGVVTVTITAPDQTTSSPSVNHPGVGLYNAVYTPAQAGTHQVRWLVTGTNAGAQNSVFEVEQPTVGIVSLDEVKAALGITRTNDDEYLRGLILQASDICESSEGTGKVWRRTVITNERYNGGAAYIVFNKRPAISVTALTIDGVAQTVSDFDVETWRLSSPFASFGGGFRRSTVLVSYIAGATAIPQGVRLGVIEMVRHLYSTKRGGSNLPRQEEPDYTASLGYLVPNRVKTSWLAYADTGLG